MIEIRRSDVSVWLSSKQFLPPQFGLAGRVAGRSSKTRVNCWQRGDDVGERFEGKRVTVRKHKHGQRHRDRGTATGPSWTRWRGHTDRERRHVTCRDHWKATCICMNEKGERKGCWFRVRFCPWLMVDKQWKQHTKETIYLPINVLAVGVKVLEWRKQTVIFCLLTSSHVGVGVGEGESVAKAERQTQT